jgi:hypothetical protein
MRCLSKWLLVIGVAALVASPVLAQGRRGGGGFGMGGPAGLINLAPVQKELKLSEDDVTKAKETIKGVTDKYADEMAKLADLPREEQMPKRMEIGAKQTEDIYLALAKDWKPEQLKRLKQLGVQQMGLNAFNSPAVAKALKLTDEQKEKVTALVGEQREEMGNMFGGGAGGDPAENQKKMANMRKEFTNKAVAILTDDQKKEWKDQTGDPFEFPAAPAGNRGGRRKKDKGN